MAVKPTTEPATEPTPVMPTEVPLAYAPPTRGRRRPPRWIGLACLLMAGGGLIVSGFLGIVAGTEADRALVGVKETRRVDGLATRALPPAEIAWVSAELRGSGRITPGQLGTIGRLLADPGQALVTPRPAGASRAGEYVPSVSPTAAGGAAVSLYGSHPFVATTVTLDAQGRLLKADTLNWSVERRTVTTVAADGTRSTVTFSRQRASAGRVIAAESTVAAAAVANGLLAVVLALVGALLLLGRPAAWPLLRRYGWAQVAAGVALAVAGQWMWWAGSIGGSPQVIKGLVWWVPGVALAGSGAVALAMGRRRNERPS